MRIVLSAITFTLLASAQRSVPIDNEQVKVLSVVDPASRPPGRMHDHKMNRVMIYLDGGTQRLAYQEGKVEDLKFRAGQALWSPASGMHTSQNMDAKPHRLVEIELKGQPKPFKAPALDPVKVHPSGYKVEIDNPQVRVIRVKMNPKQKIPLHEHALNRVVLYLKPQKIKVTPDGGAATEISPAENEVRFSTPGRHTEENLGDGPVELLIIELK
jgi:hypothetical protein